MSLVTVILVDRKKMFVKQLHWREAKALLDVKVASVEKGESILLDEGYLVVDLQQRQVLNHQRAFSVPTGWDVIDVL